MFHKVSQLFLEAEVSVRSIEVDWACDCVFGSVYMLIYNVTVNILYYRC